MELKPSKGLRVTVGAQREAVFGDESVAVKSAMFPDEKSRKGVMTGITLAGFSEVEMPSLDGKKHWYPVGDLNGVNGERVVEEEIEVDDPDDGGEE